MKATRSIKVNPDLILQKISIPGTALHALIVDDFLLNTDYTAHLAHKLTYKNSVFANTQFSATIQDEMPTAYSHVLKCFFDQFVLPETETDVASASYCHTGKLPLTTLKSSAFKPSILSTHEKTPHVDSYHNTDYICVHYLSSQELDGPSFYHYKPNDLTEFQAKHKTILSDMAENITNKYQTTSCSHSDNTSLFDTVLTIKTKLNRLIIYPANVLHSDNGNIVSPHNYFGDNQKNGLAISSFASIKHAL